jgi:hypothetical protein
MLRKRNQMMEVGKKKDLKKIRNLIQNLHLSTTSFACWFWSFCNVCNIHWDIP